MFRTNRFVPGIAAMGLVIILAACSQAATPSPSTPSSAPEPSEPTSPSASPSPSADPSESPIELVEHELPMLGRSTADGVEVHTLPSADSPLLTGFRLSDSSDVPDITMAEDELVIVTLGPVYADGISWYEVRATDGGEVYWEGGWVDGESLADEGDVPEGNAEMVVIHGVGSGTAATADVARGTPLTVKFAAVPLADDDSCELEVTVIRTDGAAVNVATQTVTEATVFQIGADIEGGGLTSLFQEEAGTVTLQVRSDCAFSANVLYP